MALLTIMTKKILIITALGMILIVLGATAYIVFKKEGTTNITKMPPEEALKQIIAENIKNEFLPSSYKVISYEEMVARREVNILPNIASRKVADLYFTDWVYENTYFNAYIAYDKDSQDFIGYDIGVRVKESELKGRELAQKYLEDVPLTGWKHGGPVHRSGLWEYDTEIFSTTFFKERAKIYLSIVSREYSEPHLVAWPEKSYIRRAGIIWYVFYMPGNPDYQRVKETQEQILWGYEK